MTSSNGNIFRVTGPFCGEFTSPVEILAQRPVTRSYGVFFDLRGHYDVIVMISDSQICFRVCRTHISKGSETGRATSLLWVITIRVKAFP